MKTHLPIRPHTLARCPWLAALLLAAAPSLRAEFLQPVAVSVTNGTDSQDALINGQGFEEPGLGSPDAVHVRAGSEMWSGIGSIRESATFDLGKSVSLTKVYIWNYNVQDATDVGMKDVEIQVSADTDMATAKFNAIARVSLAEGGEKAQVFDVVGTSVRLVRLKGLSNWGQGYTVGLAEVRFESGDIVGNVPTISINSPREGDEIALGADISIDTTVTDKDGAANIQKVAFYDGEVLLTNKTASPYLYVYKGATAGIHALRAEVTDRTGKMAWNTVNVSVRELVADRIEKIDDERDIGTELGQIQYVGAWTLAPGADSDPRYLHNDHYNASNNRNDYFEVRFKGVKVDVFATVASHHGTGWASIDGGAETKVIYKAAQRAEQVLVWSSPILPNREHVLKIRLAGDGVVTADRFDISVSDKPDVVTATVKEVVATFSNLVVRLEDTATSVVTPGSVKLTLDGVVATVTSSKAGTTTTATHVPAAPFVAGSTHLLVVDAQDGAGTPITHSSTFTLPAPPFPLAGLKGPSSSAGNWGFRQIWNGGRADSVSSAVEIAEKAALAGFAGKVSDASVPTVHHALSSNPGTAGLFPDPLPLPAESEGLAVSDFVVVARANVKVPRAGDWTLGVHSDDGFALRFIGAPFDSVNGTGVRDDDFPEFMTFLTPGETATRGILKGLKAGTYAIEFIGYQRAGGAHFDIYVAEGAFEDDSATDQWLLIGDAGGWEIVSGVSLRATSVRKQGDSVVIDFATPTPEGAHAVEQSDDLKSWQTATGAVVTKTGESSARATIAGSNANSRFYRLRAP
ncbi:MAG: hypothetical protein JNK85_09725 [Verrucomicrobiales bacterium]|nr:hypothetical protein [Verrucomicrobiales bacterium]